MLPMPSHSLDVLTSLTETVPESMVELAEGWDPAATGAAPRPSASVVLCRDGADGLETYLLHRHARMAFAASMVAFPGGGVDAVDREAADPLLACAIRETREETGVELAEADLVPWAHWITPVMLPIRYDTFFYVAAVPTDQTAGDFSTETETAVWASPADTVAAYQAETLDMMAPTLSILIELSTVPSVAQLLRLGRDRVIEIVLPEVLREDGGWVCRYPSPTRQPAR